MKPTREQTPQCRPWRGAARVAAIVAVVALLPAAVGLACQIPVFRYALERWKPDVYQLLIVSRGPLTAADEKIVAELDERARDPKLPANLEVIRVDLDEKTDDPALLLVHKKYASAQVPLFALRYGHVSVEAPPVWTAPLTKENAALLVDSPARREIVRRLIDGHSAVWVLLESGDQPADDEAAATLARELERNAKTLQLPDKAVLEADDQFRPETKVELRLEFSLLRLKHDDPAEPVLRAMLLSSEPDLKDQRAPIGLPVFGRGRACYALVGKGINAQQIEDNSKFVAGSCSCEVKRENPGVDLLIAADWDELVGVGTGDAALPELSGLGVLVVDVEPVKKPVLGARNATEPPPVETIAPPASPEPTAPTRVALARPIAKSSEEQGDRQTEPLASPGTKIGSSAGLPPAESSELATEPAPPRPTEVAPLQATEHPAAPRTDFAAGLFLVLGGIAAAGVLLAIAGTYWLRAQKATDR